MSIYTEATIGTANNQIVFNNYQNNPVFRITSRLPQKYQLRDQDEPIPFESGISDFLTLVGTTVYVIQGKMYPYDEVSFDNGLAMLRSLGSLDIEQADSDAEDDGYVPYSWSDTLGTRQIFLKVLYTQIREDTRQGFVQPFALVCKIKDPLIFGGTLKQASTAQVSTTVQTGSAAYSFKYPIVYGANLVTVTADANNIGNIPTYPTSIQVYGPITTPKITNTKTGEYIEVDVTLSSGSDILAMEYGKDKLTVTLNGVSVVNKVSNSSTYFKIEPGDNPIQLSGSAVSNGAYAVVSFYDSWALA